MSKITLIAAVGRQGQLGLNGGLPWGRQFGEDRKRFREITTGGAVIVGHNTWPSVSHLDGTHDRLFVRDYTRRLAIDLFDDVDSILGGRPIFIAGGAKTYQRWLPHITDFDVTLLPYDGPADVYAEFLLPHVTRTL